jgi:hypothetical protein
MHLNIMVRVPSSLKTRDACTDDVSYPVPPHLQVPEYLYPADSVPDYGGILVPNVDNVRTDFLIQTIMKQGKAVLLTGEQGTAKTVMIRVSPGEGEMPRMGAACGSGGRAA